MSSPSESFGAASEPAREFDRGDETEVLFPAFLVENSFAANLDSVVPSDDPVLQSALRANKSRKPEALGVFGIAKRFIHLATVVPFQLGCLVVLLAFISVMPVIQLVSLGYLLDVSGRLGRGGSLTQAISLREQAGRIGLALIFVIVLAQPIRLVSYWSVAANLVQPGAPIAETLRVVSVVMVGVVFAYLAWAWVRGGDLRHYLWPQPKRFLREGWRLGIWDEALERFLKLISSLRLPQLFWLGFRGFVGVFVWIAFPATLLVVATRQGETGLAGLVGTLAFLLMGLIVGYLPMLQAQMASANRLTAIFRLRDIRYAFKCSPFAFWMGTAVTLLMSVPLYLLKIEPIPKEIAWLPTVMFVAFMLLAHTVAGWAFCRSQRCSPRPGFLGWCWRSMWRVLSIPVVFFYLFVVYFSQLTSWDGLATWFQQHAFLVPYPFMGL